GSYASDGIPDDWQVGYFGVGNSEAGATNNIDLDSADNTAEWIADTIPTDSNSYFRLTQVTTTSNNASVYFESSASRIYNLEFTTNLTLASWSSVSNQTNQPGVDGELYLTQTNSPSGQRFYRVKVALP
ncbi:MAG: hypothetical protein KAI74_03380, partial [Kiritimatiellae bacterium]|nr:hypothetical protein [Kiritimatiellia bacterium]